MPNKFRIDRDDREQARTLAARWFLRSRSDDFMASEEVELGQWLMDGENRAAFDALIAADDAMEQLAASPQLIALRRDALRNASRGDGGVWRSAPRLSGLQAVAAGLAALIVVGLAAVLIVLRPFGVHTYQTAAGERRVVTLADNSIIALDEATRLAVRYGGGSRSVELQRGQAEFDVAHDPKRPFTVTAGKRQILATGTVFSVEIRQKALIVTLAEGRVLVSSGQRNPLEDDGAEPLRRAVELKPAEQLIIGGDNSMSVRRNVDLRVALAWKQGKLIFADEPLSEAVSRVNRYSARKVHLADLDLAGVRISGVFNAGDSAAFVDGVTAQTPVRVVVGQNREFLLYSRRSD